jgi:hypothetical protein
MLTLWGEGRIRREPQRGGREDGSKDPRGAVIFVGCRYRLNGTISIFVA